MAIYIYIIYIYNYNIYIYRYMHADKFGSLCTVLQHADIVTHTYMHAAIIMH